MIRLSPVSTTPTLPSGRKKIPPGEYTQVWSSKALAAVPVNPRVAIWPVGTTPITRSALPSPDGSELGPGEMPPLPGNESPPLAA